MHLTVFTLLGVYSMTESLAVSPWLDTSMCPPTDVLTTCMKKKTMCGPINQLMSPPGGLIKAITTCANTTGAVMDPKFYMTVGQFYAKGSPELMIDNAVTDPAIRDMVRICVVNATGMLDANLNLNRTQVINTLASQPIDDSAAIFVAIAAYTCPEPVGLQIEPYMSCIRKACMESVVVPLKPTFGKPAKKSFPTVG